MQKKISIFFLFLYSTSLFALGGNGKSIEILDKYLLSEKRLFQLNVGSSVYSYAVTTKSSSSTVESDSTISGASPYISLQYFIKKYISISTSLEVPLLTSGSVKVMTYALGARFYLYSTGFSLKSSLGEKSPSSLFPLIGISSISKSVTESILNSSFERFSKAFCAEHPVINTNRTEIINIRFILV